MRRPLLALCLLVACKGPSASSGEPTPRSVATASALPQTPADPREGSLAAAVTKLLESEHVKHRTLDDAVSKIAFKRYLDALDPGKMFLTAPDELDLERYALEMDDELHAGRLELAHVGAARLQERIGDVRKFVDEILAKPFDLTKGGTLETDPKKVAYAASLDDLRARWHDRLQLEVLERVIEMEDRLAADAKKGGTAAAGKTPTPAATPSPHPVPAVQPTPPDDDGADDADAGPPSNEPVPTTADAREAKARADLAKTYSARFARLAEPEPLDAATAFIEAVATTFDPHTDYLPKDDKDNFDIQLTGTLEGIGAVLQEQDHYIKVNELVPGGASWQQGELEAGDLILAVAQAGKAAVDVTDMRIDAVVKMIRGKKGTIVTLKVQKPDGTTKEISITRDKVVIEDAYARGAELGLKSDKREFGYINLPSFYGGQGDGQRSAAEDVRRLLTEFAKRKVAGVILDLRSNGGGLLDDARVMTGLLVDSGPVVQTMESSGAKETLSDDDPGITYDGPVVVLIDRFSASASEIVAAALQDYGRAVLVGTTTHGKGTVQVLADLDRLVPGSAQPLGELKLTIQQFFRISGSSTQWKGVVPDIDLPDPLGYLKSREKDLENSLPWSSIAPLDHTPWSATWNLADLAAHSRDRVGKSDVFKQVGARTELLRARQDQSALPLAHDAWIAMRDQQKAELEKISPKLDKGPARFTVSVVDYDGKAAAVARPGGKADDRTKRWSTGISHDPWLEEGLFVLRDMADGKAATAPVAR